MGNGFSTALGDDALALKVADAAEEALVRLRGDDSELDIVSLPNHGIGDDALFASADSLSQAHHVVEIDLAYNNIGHVGMRSFSHALRRTPSRLVVLRLSGNPLGLEGCRAVCEWLEATLQTTALEELYLYHCNLDDECVLLLANVLQRHTTLRALNLDMNPVSEKASRILLELLRRNETLSELSCTPMDAEVLYKDAVVDELQERLAANRLALERRLANDQLAAEKAAQRKARRNETEARRAAAAAAEAERARELERQLQERIAEQDREVEARQAELEAKEAEHEALRRDREDRKQRALERAIAGTEEWRAKMTNGNTLQKEWRSGFTVLRAAPGDLRGMPTVSAEAPRRLKACWCDPVNAAAPYAKKLHYHCKHEVSIAEMKDENGDIKPYCGCQQTGHCCASLNFYAKPKPDTSAAFFFASQAPGPAV